MAALIAQRRGDPQKLPLRTTDGRHHLDDVRLASRQSPRLVERQDLQAAHLFKRTSSFDQNPAGAAAATALTTATGVAITKAQGHAVTKTTNPRIGQLDHTGVCPMKMFNNGGTNMTVTARATTTGV